MADVVYVEHVNEHEHEHVNVYVGPFVAKADRTAVPPARAEE